jgi:hypothetical protein
VVQSELNLSVSDTVSRTASHIILFGTSLLQLQEERELSHPQIVALVVNQREIAEVVLQQLASNHLHGTMLFSPSFVRTLTTVLWINVRAGGAIRLHPRATAVSRAVNLTFLAMV